MCNNFLPSEIARLVLGYLHDTSCPISYQHFLGESPFLQECRMIVQHNGLNLLPNLWCMNLVEMLNDYAVIKANMKQQVNLKSKKNSNACQMYNLSSPFDSNILTPLNCASLNKSGTETIDEMISIKKIVSRPNGSIMCRLPQVDRFPQINRQPHFNDDFYDQDTHLSKTEIKTPLGPVASKKGRKKKILSQTKSTYERSENKKCVTRAAAKQMAMSAPLSLIEMDCKSVVYNSSNIINSPLPSNTIKNGREFELLDTIDPSNSTKDVYNDSFNQCNDSATECALETPKKTHHRKKRTPKRINLPSAIIALPNCVDNIQDALDIDRALGRILSSPGKMAAGINQAAAAGCSFQTDALQELLDVLNAGSTFSAADLIETPADSLLDALLEASGNLPVNDDVLSSRAVDEAVASIALVNQVQIASSSPPRCDIIEADGENYVTNFCKTLPTYASDSSSSRTILCSNSVGFLNEFYAIPFITADNQIIESQSSYSQMHGVEVTSVSATADESALEANIAQTDYKFVIDTSPLKHGIDVTAISSTVNKPAQEQNFELPDCKSIMDTKFMSSSPQKHGIEIASVSSTVNKPAQEQNFELSDCKSVMDTKSTSSSPQKHGVEVSSVSSTVNKPAQETDIELSDCKSVMDTKFTSSSPQKHGVEVSSVSSTVNKPAQETDIELSDCKSVMDTKSTSSSPQKHGVEVPSVSSTAYKIAQEQNFELFDCKSKMDTKSMWSSPQKHGVEVTSVSSTINKPAQETNIELTDYKSKSDSKSLSSGLKGHHLEIPSVSSTTNESDGFEEIDVCCYSPLQLSNVKLFKFDKSTAATLDSTLTCQRVRLYRLGCARTRGPFFRREITKYHRDFSEIKNRESSKTITNVAAEEFDSGPDSTGFVSPSKSAVPSFVLKATLCPKTHLVENVNANILNLPTALSMMDVDAEFANYMKASSVVYQDASIFAAQSHAASSDSSVNRKDAITSKSDGVSDVFSSQSYQVVGKRRCAQRNLTAALQDLTSCKPRHCSTPHTSPPPKKRILYRVAAEQQQQLHHQHFKMENVPSYDACGDATSAQMLTRFPSFDSCSLDSVATDLEMLTPGKIQCLASKGLVVPSKDIKNCNFDDCPADFPQEDMDTFSAAQSAKNSLLDADCKNNDLFTDQILSCHSLVGQLDVMNVDTFLSQIHTLLPK